MGHRFAVIIIAAIIFIPRLIFCYLIVAITHILTYVEIIILVITTVGLIVFLFAVFSKLIFPFFIFIVFFFISGGFLLMLEMLYRSFRIWNVFSWMPTLRAESIPLWIAQISQLMVLMLLIASPIVVAMLLAEMGLALVSRFVPQLQVFFLAMPIKSALAFLVLVLYVGVLFDYADTLIGDLSKSLEFLDDQWRPPVGPLR